MRMRTSLFPALLSSAVTWWSLYLRVNSSEQLTPQLKITIACFVTRHALSLADRFVQAPRHKRLLQIMRSSLSLLERAMLILLVSR